MICNWSPCWSVVAAHYLVVVWLCYCYQFFYEGTRSTNVPFFLRKHFMHACSTIIFVVLQRLIRHLSSAVNPIVAEQIYLMQKLCHWCLRIFIYQLNNFYIDNICKKITKMWCSQIRVLQYSATSTEIFVQIW